MLSSISHRCRKELTHQFEGKQRSDIVVYDFKDGKKLLLDVTIAHPWGKKYMTKSFSTAAFAAAEREKQKNSEEGN